jgi:tetratricopeptide (TPR) repeat protein
VAGYHGSAVTSTDPTNLEGNAVPAETRTYGGGRGQSIASAANRDPVHLAAGSAVHRYTILERVGEGGMGIVYAAYDPSLDRRVALKFLRPRSDDRQGVREKRLLREAQAMARLSHPNVAVVYEVGTFEHHLFLAMEFVDGDDLRAWAAGPRSFSEILTVFLAAGRGLAAAHAAHIVHRDFKPENVLLDRHGRPRVTDFGLSRASHEADEDAPDPPAEVHSTPLSAPSLLSSPLTRTGGRLGTPSYMAPEQHLGAAADERSDQFSFCVALYEALYRMHPFGQDPADRPGNLIAGRISPAPAQSAVPRWCRQALLRGLAPAPADRFPELEALLAALAPHPTRRRRLAVTAGALALLLAGAAVPSLLAGEPAASSGPRCNLGAQRLSGVWDGLERQRLREAFRRSGARGADVTWSSFSAILDGRATAWAAMHDEACAATHVRGVQSPAVLDLRMECLERKRQEMKSLVEVYAGALEASSLDRAVGAADKLSSVAACADVANLRAVTPLPDDPAVRRKVESIRGRLAHSRALYEAGRYAQGREYMTGLKQEADAVGYAPLAAEAANALATHLSHAGELKEAEKVLLAAADRAVEGSDWNQEAEAWLELLANYGRDGRVPEATLAARVADLAVRRAHGDESMQATLERHTGYIVGLTEGLHGELPHHQRAEKLWRSSLGTRSPRYAYFLCEIGSTLVNLGRVREGLDYLERTLQLQQQILRPEHPDVGETLYAIGVAHNRLGNLHIAREFARRAADIRVHELGPEHPLTLRTRQLVSLIEVSLGSYDRALESLEELLSIARRRRDAKDPVLGIAYLALGLGQLHRERSDEAQRTFRQVIRHEARAGIPENIGTALALTNMGALHNSRGRAREAGGECRRALDILSRKLGPHSTRSLPALECLGDALLAMGDAKLARAELERGLAGLDERDVSPVAVAGVRFQLARALWAVREERGRALELARASLKAVTAAEGDNRRLIERIQKWLSRHSP